MTPTIPLHDFGGTGPVLHLALANGFPPGSYTPLLDPFTTDYRVVSLPPRALWPQIGPPPEADSWRTLADDLLTGMDQHDLRDVIAVGHSFGGVASMLAAIADPGRFRALILLDPTILPPDTMASIDQMRQQDQMIRLPLVYGALNRRAEFADAADAFAYWRDKPLFQDWSDDALWHYTRAMTRPADDGTGVTLTWPRTWEAHYYRTIYTKSWADLPRLAGLLPTLIVAGEQSDAFPPESAARARDLLPAATHVALPGYGHLFPHAAPDQTRDIIANWLARAL